VWQQVVEEKSRILKKTPYNQKIVAIPLPYLRESVAEILLTVLTGQFGAEGQYDVVRYTIISAFICSLQKTISVWNIVFLSVQMSAY